MSKKIVIFPNNKLALLVAGIIGIFLTSLVQMVHAIPANFDWGSFDAGGATSFGVYDEDNSTILESGDLVELIWAGPDGLVDPPQAEGGPGGDDMLLATAAIVNGGSLPPPLQNKGYIPLQTYSYDTEDIQQNGTVYIRAWNAPDVEQATAYGNSETVILSEGGVFLANRWHTDQSISSSFSIWLPLIVK